MISYLASCLLGIVCGILTGLVPGIHPNTVIFTSLPVYLSTDIGQGIYVSYMTGLSVSHTFHDFLPAIFLSAPEAESALSVVAAPEMVKEGEGLKAFHATVRGGLTSSVAFILFSIPLYFFLKPFYSFLSKVMVHLLLFFLVYIVLDAEDSMSAFLLIIFSGSLGILSFQSPVNQQFVLIPIFSGLFAVPGLYSIISEGEFTVPDQDNPESSLTEISYQGFAGTLAGLLAGTVPGIGAAVSTSFLSPLLEESKEKFLVAMGAVNTSDIFFSLLSLYLIGNARSGVSVALQAIMRPGVAEMTSLGLLSFFAVAISAPLSLKVGDLYVDRLQGLKIQKIAFPVLLLILIVTLVLTGVLGLLVLLVSGSLGFVAQRTDERKACMAVLLIPAILSFAGVGIFM